MVGLLELEELPQSHTSSSLPTENEADNDFSSGQIGKGSLVPSGSVDFSGQLLKSGDGRFVVPFISRYFRWSFSVAWMSQADPSKWMDDISKDYRRTRSLESVFIPLVDFLVYKNKSLVAPPARAKSKRTLSAKMNLAQTPFSNQLTSSSSSLSNDLQTFEVKKHVVKIAFTCGDGLDDVGKDTGGGILTTVCTTHVLTQLLDKLMWASDLKMKGKGPDFVCLDDDDVGAIEQPLPIEHLYATDVDESKKSKIDAVVTWHRKIHVNWKAVVQDFVKEWMSYQDHNKKKGIIRQQKASASAGASPDFVLKKMYEDAEGYKSTSTVAKALSRIHDAALALGTFRLFNLSDNIGRTEDGEKDEKDKKSRKDFKFHEALLYVTSICNLSCSTHW